MGCGAQLWTSGRYQIATSNDCMRTAVNTLAYDKDITALLVVDPYNDFISEGGKIRPRIEAVAEANNCVAHMLEVLNASRRQAC
jgi:hypothetical protein